MNTSPGQTGRPRSTTPRRPASAAPKRAAPRPPIQLAETGATDGSLSLVTEAGTVIQLVPVPVAESLRYMMARLRLGDGVDLPERIGVTSALTGEGTTFLARSMALVLSNDAARRVCLVDLNWWSPSTWPDDLGDQSGLADVIRGNLPLEHAVLETGNAGLSVLPAGTASATERPLLAHHPALDKSLVELSESFDHIVIDLPAIRATSESLRLAEAARSVALVAQQGATPDDQVRGVIEELHGVHVLGLILNRNSTKIPRVIRRRIPGASDPLR